MFQCFGSSAPRSEARLPSSAQNNGKLRADHLSFALFALAWFCVCSLTWVMTSLLIFAVRCGDQSSARWIAKQDRREYASEKEVDESLLLQSENRLSSRELVGSLRSESKPLHEQVDLGFKRRDSSFVKKVFDKHCDRQSGSISKHRLHSALAELGLDIDQQRAWRISLRAFFSV